MQLYHEYNKIARGMIKEKKIAIIIFLIYLCIIPGAAFLSLKFLDHTSMSFLPPKGTIVYKGKEMAEKYFPSVLPMNPLYMLVKSRNTSQSIVDDPLFEEFSQYLALQVTNESSLIFGVVTDILGYFLVPDFPIARNPFLGGDHNQTTMFRFSIALNMRTNTASQIVEEMVDTWCSTNGADFERGYTSIDLVTGDAKGGIIGDLMRVDVFALPLAFVVLACCVGSIRLLLVSAMSFIATISIAFGIMYPISFAVEVSSFAPELALGVMAAISVDYSLFILTRFREQIVQQEVLLGPSPQTQWIVVKNTAVMSAHNIILSGLTIAVAVGSISFLPVAFLSTIGLTTCVGSVVAVFVSLTIQPALLLIFYDFFSRTLTWADLKSMFRSCICRCCSCCRSPERGWSDGESLDFTVPVLRQSADGCREDGNDNNDIVPSNSRQDEYEAEQYRKQSASIWFKIGLFSVRHPFLSIFGVLAFGAPFFYFASQLRVDFDLFSQIPEGAPHGKILETIENEVAGGSVIPFYITFAVRGTYDVNYWKSGDMTNTMQSVIEAIVARTGQKYEAIMAPNMLALDGKVRWLSGIESIILRNLNESYDYLFNRTVSLPDMKAAYIALTPPINPFGASADKYLNTIHDILNEHASNNVFFDYGLAGSDSASWTTMHETMDYFVYQVIAVFAAIFIFVMAVFRSVALPLRMIFTVAYTVLFSYGVGVIVFQYKWLRPVWKGLYHVESYCFLVPIFAFMLLSALALDYDVFLMTRIIEFKEMGYTNEAAIVKAVWKTGRIISMAGLVMLVTIGALTLSTTMLLAQFGVICGTAVIIDTFVIRPFFAPALMSLLPDKALWWPRRFPNLNRNFSDMRMTTQDSKKKLSVK